MPYRRDDATSCSLNPFYLMSLSLKSIAGVRSSPALARSGSCDSLAHIAAMTQWTLACMPLCLNVLAHHCVTLSRLCANVAHCDALAQQVRQSVTVM